MINKEISCHSLIFTWFVNSRYPFWDFTDIYPKNILYFEILDPSWIQILYPVVRQILDTHEIKKLVKGGRSIWNAFWAYLLRNTHLLVNGVHLNSRKCSKTNGLTCVQNSKVEFFVMIMGTYHRHKNKPISTSQLPVQWLFSLITVKTRIKEPKFKNLQPEISQPILNKNGFVKQILLTKLYRYQKWFLTITWSQNPSSA